MEKILLNLCLILWKCFVLAPFIVSSSSPSTSLHHHPSLIKPTEAPFSSRQKYAPALSSTILQEQSLTITRNRVKTGKSPMGETQFSMENRQERSVSQENICIYDNNHATNDYSNNLYFTNEHGIFFLFPKDDFEYVSIILTVNNGKQYLTFTKENLCVNETNRWYKFYFSTTRKSKWIADVWAINIKGNSCSKLLSTDYWYLLNWFRSIIVSGKGGYCLTNNESLITPTETSTTSVDVSTFTSTISSTFENIRNNTQEAGGDMRLFVTLIIFFIVFSLIIVLVISYLKRRNGRKKNRHSSASHNEAMCQNDPIYENVNLEELQEDRQPHSNDPVYTTVSLELQGSRVSHHDSENSIYSAVRESTISSTKRSSAHDSENSIYMRFNSM